MIILFRILLIASFLPLASGCSNFGQAKLQRVQMPIENDGRSVSLDDQRRDATQVIANAGLMTKKPAEIKTKEVESPKEPKTLKVEDLPPALKLLSLKSEQEAKDKLSGSKPVPLSIPPLPSPTKKLQRMKANQKHYKKLNLFY